MEFTKYLQKQSLKVTPGRQQLFKIISQTAEPLSFEQIEAQYSQKDKSTLYRNLNLFKEIKIVDMFLVDKQPKYILSGLFEDSIFIVCSQCGCAKKADCQPILHRALEEIGENTHFSMLSHQAILYGECQKCRA
ncbi:MAG: transcriptional repressor [Candidatus Sacchiramonaceae bacterium]|nr:transcriptional repressor [Candidatus Saccharimonadaceae bacterium]